MRELMQLALQVARRSGLARTWALLVTIESAIGKEAELAGCTVGEAANTISKEVFEARKRGEIIDLFYFKDARWRNRLDHMRRLSKEERKVVHGDKFMGDCPSCGEGNLYLHRKRNGDLFVACDGYYSDCRCQYGYAVPEIPTTQPGLSKMTEIEHAKAAVAAALRCPNCGTPITQRTNRWGGQFLCCTVKGCGYTESLPSVS